MVLELGLNRRLVLDRSFTDSELRKQAINTIWSIHILDQHLSYALGLSAAARSLQLDASYPEPVREHGQHVKEEADINSCRLKLHT